MPITTTLPDWLAAGVQPPESLRTNGWEEGQKPAAEYFNWFFSTSYYALKDLAENAASQQDLDDHKNNQTNPHNVTKTQVGLSNVDNVQQASKANFDAHTQDNQNPHGVTASQVGASPTDHGHSNATTTTAGFMSGSDKTKLNAMPPAADVETEDGAQTKANTAEQAAIDWVKSFGLGSNSKLLSSGVDLNTVRTTGFYYTNSSPNTPTGVNGYLLVISHGSATSDQTQQLFFKNDTDSKPYYRRYYSGAWQAWNQLETTAGAQARADERIKRSGDTMEGALNMGRNNFTITDANGDSWVVNGNNGGIVQITKGGTGGAEFQLENTSNDWNQAILRIAGKKMETEAGAQAKADAIQTWTEGYGLGSKEGKVVGDLNNALESGFYSASSNTANVPTSAYYSVIVSSRTVGVVSQLAIRENSNDIFYRTYNGGTWNPWMEIAQLDKVVKKSGDTMEGTLNSQDVRVLDGRIYHAKQGVYGAFGWTKYEPDGTTLDYSSYMAQNAKHDEDTGAWTFERDSMGAYLIKIGQHGGFQVWESTDATPTAGHPITWDKKDIETTTGAQEKADSAETNAKNASVSKIGRDDITVNNYSSNQKLLGFLSSKDTKPEHYEWFLLSDGRLGIFDRLNGKYIAHFDHTKGAEFWDGTEQVSIADLKQSVSNGKQQVRDAVIDKGGTVADADSDGVPTFQELTDGVNGLIASGVSNIQRGQISSVTDSQVIDISPVDLTRSVVLVDIFNPGTYQNDTYYTGEFLNESQIEVKRDVSGEYSTGVSWTVIEFNGVKSLQTGFVDIPPADDTVSVAISTVDPAKTMHFWSWRTDYRATSHYSAGPFAFDVGIDSLTIKSRVDGSSTIKTAKWWLVEFE